MIMVDKGGCIIVEVVGLEKTRNHIHPRVAAMLSFRQG